MLATSYIHCNNGRQIKTLIPYTYLLLRNCRTWGCPRRPCSRIHEAGRSSRESFRPQSWGRSQLDPNWTEKILKKSTHVKVALMYFDLLFYR